MHLLYFVWQDQRNNLYSYGTANMSTVVFEKVSEQIIKYHLYLCTM